MDSRVAALLAKSASLKKEYDTRREISSAPQPSTHPTKNDPDTLMIDGDHHNSPPIASGANQLPETADGDQPTGPQSAGSKAPGKGKKRPPSGGSSRRVSTRSSPSVTTTPSAAATPSVPLSAGSPHIFPASDGWFKKLSEMGLTPLLDTAHNLGVDTNGMLKPDIQGALMQLQGEAVVAYKGKDKPVQVAAGAKLFQSPAASGQA